MTVTLGIDTSRYQDPTPTSDPSDDIDWAKVARTPYRFAVVRMTIGMGVRDDTGRRDLKAALDHLPAAGAYGVVGLAEPAEDGARFLVDEIAKVTDPAKVLVMLDAEDFSRGQHPTIDQVDRYARQIHAEVGRWPVAYVPAWWLSKHGYTAAGRALANCPWAQSHYLSSPWTETKLQANKPSLQYGFKQLAWLQYTDAATVSGVAGRVDANCYYGTLDQLRAQLLGQPKEDLSMADAQDILNRLDFLALWIAGRANRVYSPGNLADRLSKLIGEPVAADFDTPIAPATLTAAFKTVTDKLDAGLTVGLTPTQVAEIKQALAKLEGTALIQLAVSPAP